MKSNQRFQYFLIIHKWGSLRNATWSYVFTRLQCLYSTYVNVSAIISIMFIQNPSYLSEFLLGLATKLCKSQSILTHNAMICPFSSRATTDHENHEEQIFKRTFFPDSQQKTQKHRFSIAMKKSTISHSTSFASRDSTHNVFFLSKIQSQWVAALCTRVWSQNSVRPIVNLTSNLRAAFVQISFCQKNTNLNNKHQKAAQRISVQKSCS